MTLLEEARIAFRDLEIHSGRWKEIHNEREAAALAGDWEQYGRLAVPLGEADEKWSAASQRFYIAGTVLQLEQMRR
jgi:hypothetical protein